MVPVLLEAHLSVKILASDNFKNTKVFKIRCVLNIIYKLVTEC